MEEFREGNACWNCRYINTCRPSHRPFWHCGCYAPLGEPISHKKIGELMGVGRTTVDNIITDYGAEKIVDLLNNYGYILRFDRIGSYNRFFLLN